MQNDTHMTTDQRNGNLHIRLNGYFSPDTAAMLTLTMAKAYQGKGNIFIHTERVTAVAADARYAFTHLLSMSGLPGENIYLTGIQGLEICHDMGKVIIRRSGKHGGCGRCNNCSCHKKEAA